jgi:hypothetical protein
MDFPTAAVLTANCEVRHTRRGSDLLLILTSGCGISTWS